jgi:hypothetical protein
MQTVAPTPAGSAVQGPMNVAEAANALAGILPDEGQEDSGEAQLPEEGAAADEELSTEADAVDVIKKMLQLTNTSYDEDRLSIGTPKRNNFQRSQKQLVYGKQVKIKRYRPTANVYFRYAYVEIPGKPKPVFLVDTTFNNTALVFTR